MPLLGGAFKTLTHHADTAELKAVGDKEETELEWIPGRSTDKGGRMQTQGRADKRVGLAGEAARGGAQGPPRRLATSLVGVGSGWGGGELWRTRRRVWREGWACTRQR